MAISTIHFWDDLGRGLHELRRIARKRVVILTWDPESTSEYWLFRDYLPETAAWDAAIAPPIAELAAMLGGAEIRPLMVPHDCTDGFTRAFWRRPHAYLDPAVRAANSIFTRPDAPPTEAGLAQLASDLADGVWHERNGGLMNLEEHDVGYRILVAETVT